MSEQRLTGFIGERIKNNVYPFHMPGHKGNINFLYKHLLNADITEISGADNLHDAEPKGVIGSLQNKIKTLFGAEESLLLVNGSTAGVIAAVMSVCRRNEKILVARNAHKSLYSGLILSGANPVYVMPKITEYGFAGGVSPSSIEKALDVDPSIKAVFVTSPTYEGVVSDINEIATITRRFGKMLIVDEAHGVHFGFSGYFPETALKCGADIVIQSLHKTLPSLGQSAVLHFRNNAIGERLKRFAKIIQTSSPSYLIMAQADYCMELLEKKGAEIFGGYVEMLESFRVNAAQFRNIPLIGGEIIGKASVFDFDKGKLLFRSPESLPGFEVEKVLLNKFFIQTEWSSQDYVLAMTSCADKQEGFDRLLDAMEFINRNYSPPVQKAYTAINQIPEAAMTPADANDYCFTEITLEKSNGRICAEVIAPFPPGIALAAPGEVLTEWLATQIAAYYKDGMNHKIKVTV